MNELRALQNVRAGVAVTDDEEFPPDDVQRVVPSLRRVGRLPTAQDLLDQ